MIGSCGDAFARARWECPTPETPEDEYDSDDYPKGPYPDGGGESDSPQHCDACGVFLENPLTSDGDEYVARSVLHALRDKRPGAVCITQWLECYDYITLADVIEQARNQATDDEQPKGKGE